MQSEFEECRKKAEAISRIFILAQDIYLYTEYFHNPDSKEEKYLITNSPHSLELSKIRHFMFRTLITEVSKLISKSNSDKYRIDKFIKSFLPGGRYIQFNIPVDIINLWELNLSKHNFLIKDILILRSKLYAHTDDIFADFDHLDIDFPQIHNLLNTISIIIKEIYRHAFNINLSTRSPSFERNKFILLKLLAKAEQQRSDEIFKKYRNGSV